MFLSTKEVIPILTYHNPIRTKDNLTLSIDNIVLDLYISRQDVRERLLKLLEILPFRCAVETVYWCSVRPGSFRDQFSIKLQDGTSFWLGLVLNGNSLNWGRCRMEFNPNKVSRHEVFQVLLQFLAANTRPMHREIRRYDLAIDIPVQRQSCFLVKDNRAYLERRHGQEWTQYLGAKSSTVGRVKLYNKQVESGLSHPLTRLEITLDPAVPYEKINFPTVYFLNDLQMCFEEMRATDTERFILNALLQGVGSLNDLGRKTRAKIEVLMSHYTTFVKISPADYKAILDQLRAYTNGTAGSEATDPDQPPKPSAPPLPDWVAAADGAEEDDKLPL